MASLADIVKRNSQVIKRGGSLFETPVEPLQGTVSGQGLLPGAAVSPQAASGLGVTADQAKMAGSQAQLQNAIRQSIEPERQPRREVFRQVETEGEKAAKERAGKLAGLEALGGRVSTLVNTYIQEKAPVTNVTPVGILDEEQLKKDKPDLTEAQLASIRKALETGVVDAELFTIFNFRPDQAKELGVELKKYAKSAGSTAISGLSKALGEDLPISQLEKEDYDALGVAGVGDLAGLLGVTEGDLSTMTLGQLQQKIDSISQQDFARVNELQRIANDPVYSDAVRADAQRQLRELSAAGVQATEADFDRLNNAVQSADVIRVGDQDMTVAELISDEGITSIITSYLSTATDNAEYKKLIEDQYPDLVAFINQNETVLRDAMKSLDAGVAAKGAVQEANAALNTYNTVDMTDVNKLVFGTAYDPSKPSDTNWSEQAKSEPIYKVLSKDNKELSDEDKLEYAKFLSEMAKINSTILSDTYKNADSTTLRSMAAAAGMSPAEYFKKELQRQKTLQFLKYPTTTMSDDAAVYSVFGGQPAWQVYVDRLKDINLYTSLGMGEVPEDLKPLITLLDSNNDGIPDSTADIRARLLNYVSNNPLRSLDGLATLATKMAEATSAAKYETLWSKVKDGVLTLQEANEVIAANDDKQIAKLYDLIKAKSDKLKVEDEALIPKQKTEDEKSLERLRGLGFTEINQAWLNEAFSLDPTKGTDFGTPIQKRLLDLPATTWSKSVRMDTINSNMTKLTEEATRINRMIEIAKLQKNPQLQKDLERYQSYLSKNLDAWNKYKKLEQDDIDYKRNVHRATTPTGRQGMVPRYPTEPEYALPAGWYWAEEPVGRFGKQYYAKRK